MDDTVAASLALDAAQVLKGIGEDVAQIKGQNSDVLAALDALVARDSEPLVASDDGTVTLSSDPDPADWVTEVHSSAEVPAEFFPDLMGFQYMQTVLLVFVLVALLLNLGANLWLAFSDKWRS